MMLKVVKELMRTAGPRSGKVYASLILSMLESVLTMVPLAVVFFIVASIPELNPSAEPLTAGDIQTYIFVMVACLVARMILTYSIKYLRNGVGYEMMCDERRALGSELRRASMGYFSKRNLGDIAATVTSDAGFIELYGMGALERMITGILGLATGIGLLLILDWRAAVAVSVMMIPAYLSFRYVVSFLDAPDLNRQKQIGKATEDTIEYVKGLHVLKSCNMADNRFRKTEESFACLARLMLTGELRYIPRVSLYMLCFRIITVMIVIVSALLFIGGEITFQAAAVMMLASFSIFAAVEAMGEWSPFSRMTQQSLDRINHVKNIKKMDDAAEESVLKRHGVTFDSVSFGYGTKDVLHEISFNVPEGTMTALVGMSGSGKTTVLNLIARFWDVNRGKVSVGERDVREIPFDDLLGCLSFVFQDVFLFNDTVLNNIRIGRPEATMAEVEEAAKKAGCHEFITRMRDGYDTMIGESGSTLSGGERQRISIARALIKDAPIILLDEVTANIDAENEREIQMALQELLTGRTVIMIAHKLSTIRHADQILVMEEGHIMQKGTHEELVCQQGIYERLWNMQYQTSRWKF